MKKGGHTEQWPWAVEILHHQETIHVSLSSFKDQTTLMECIGRQEGVPAKVQKCICVHISTLVYCQYMYCVVCPCIHDMYTHKKTYKSNLKAATSQAKLLPRAGLEPTTFSVLG